MSSCRKPLIQLVKKHILSMVADIISSMEFRLLHCPYPFHGGRGFYPDRTPEDRYRKDV